WIMDCLADYDFRTVLDAFAGTGSVAYAFKHAGKAVTCNDLLAFNHQIGLALIENKAERLTHDQLEALLAPRDGEVYDDFIARTFEGIYFTAEENRWLDVVVQNLAEIPCRYRRSLGFFAVFQAAMAKRPYNLFHRRNLYMRTADVARTFGNKATWDRPFEDHVRCFAKQGAEAVFDSGTACVSTHGDVMDIAGTFELVYVDPPYMNSKGIGVDYHHFYHFLEGLTDYRRWGERVDHQSHHRRLHAMPSPWTKPGEIHGAFERVFECFSESILAVSYRSDGIPSVDELVAMLRRFKGRVTCHACRPSPYALSKNRGTREVLLVGSDNRPTSVR
ncbi:MAG: DNA adenine methylase, partial [Planctomycetes bacterium]|nr:DNA adenine methylase [Planctomycetota bacterium]